MHVLVYDPCRPRALPHSLKKCTAAGGDGRRRLGAVAERSGIAAGRGHRHRVLAPDPLRDLETTGRPGSGTHVVTYRVGHDRPWASYVV